MDNQLSVRHFTHADLALQSDPSGASYWAVALDRAMLTYFEVPPGYRFETHQHESEQITMVLEGELHFEVAGTVTRVAAGEVIAIPSNAPHAAFTTDTAARAVDAWSPPREFSVSGR